MITLSKLSGIVRQHARRGLVVEQGFWINVTVPAWRVTRMRQVLRGVACDVKALTVWQHLTVWTVHVRTS